MVDEITGLLDILWMSMMFGVNIHVAVLYYVQIKKKIAYKL